MPLPLNLAMTPAEITAAETFPAQIAWMSCHFSPGGTGLVDTPRKLPEGAMLILDDSVPCSGHSAGLIADFLYETVSRLRCGSVLLDFQRSGNTQAAAIAAALAAALPCPVGVSPEYAVSLSCPVFLPPAPLHIPMQRYLRPWQGREIWLEAALCREVITVTKKGTAFAEAEVQEDGGDGFCSQSLCCRYKTRVQQDCAAFTLFDTPETLERKLDLSHTLGVTRAVGLYQELGPYFGKSFG